MDLGVCTMISRTLPAIGVALALCGCASGPTIKTDQDPTADLSRYHTYSWVYRAPPAGMNPLLFERISQSIDRGLAARGFTKAQPGDFAVAFTVGARDKVQVDDFGPYGAFYPGVYRGAWARGYSNVEVRQYTEGTLAIDVFDTATKRPVWHGTASQDLPSNGPDQATIDNAIDSVLARFAPPDAPVN
jgi:hypothetical protein